MKDNKYFCKAQYGKTIIWKMWGFVLNCHLFIYFVCEICFIMYSDCTIQRNADKLIHLGGVIDVVFTWLWTKYNVASYLK